MLHVALHRHISYYCLLYELTSLWLPTEQKLMCAFVKHIRMWRLMVKECLLVL